MFSNSNCINCSSPREPLRGSYVTQRCHPHDWLPCFSTQHLFAAQPCRRALRESSSQPLSGYELRAVISSPSSIYLHLSSVIYCCDSRNSHHASRCRPLFQLLGSSQAFQLWHKHIQHSTQIVHCPMFQTTLFVLRTLEGQWIVSGAASSRYSHAPGRSNISTSPNSVRGGTRAGEGISNGSSKDFGQV